MSRLKNWNNHKIINDIRDKKIMWIVIIIERLKFKKKKKYLVMKMIKVLIENGRNYDLF